MIKFMNECTKRKRSKKRKRKNTIVPDKLVYLKLFTGWLDVTLPGPVAMIWKGLRQVLKF